MNTRRAARGSAPTAAPGGFPAELAAGPCIERWADPPGSMRTPHSSARRNWDAAVRAWAEEAGMEPHRALALARIRVPWSREYMRETGRAALVDYLDGRRATHPGDPNGRTIPPFPWEHNAEPVTTPERPARATRARTPKSR